MKSKNALYTFALSALGMLLGEWMWNHLLMTNTAFASIGSDSLQSLNARELTILDSQGRRRILIGMGKEGTPGIWFLDENGKSRLNLGLYGDGNSFLVMNDEQERAVEIFRTHGNQSAPVLVMKSEGSDRIILGLRQDNKEPVFVTFDGKGNKNTIFGNW